jgi:hypothetical protein
LAVAIAEVVRSFHDLDRAEADSTACGMSLEEIITDNSLDHLGLGYDHG